MFEFGDELSLESYKIPWLIWIQLLVLFLLIFLLYGFSLLASDRSDNYSSTASPSTSRMVSNENQIEKSIPKHNNTSIVTNCLETTQVWISLPFFSMWCASLKHVLVPCCTIPNSKIPTTLFVCSIHTRFGFWWLWNRWER